MFPFPPLQDPQRTKCVPAAGRAEAFEFKVRLAGVAVLEQPAAARLLARADDTNSLGEAMVARRVDSLKVVESPQDVVVPPWREGETGELGLIV